MRIMCWPHWDLARRGHPFEEAPPLPPPPPPRVPSPPRPPRPSW